MLYVFDGAPKRSVLGLHLLLPLYLYLLRQRDLLLTFDKVLYMRHHVLALDLRLFPHHRPLSFEIWRVVLLISCQGNIFLDDRCLLIPDVLGWLFDLLDYLLVLAKLF